MDFQDQISLDSDEDERQEDNLTLEQETQIFYTHCLDNEENATVTEVGQLAAWSCSSFKEECPISKIRDDDPETYWQSDGSQPHFIDIHFSKQINVKIIGIFIDHDRDESYTPIELEIQAGNGYHDILNVINFKTLRRGWNLIRFNNKSNDKILKTFLIRIIIIGNLQDGKDTRIRQIKVFSPKDHSSIETGEIGLPFTSIKMLSETSIR